MGNSRSVLLTFLNVGRTCTQLWVHVTRASIDFSIGKRVFITRYFKEFSTDDSLKVS